MDISFGIQSVANIIFLVVVILLGIASLLSIYIFIKYGRTRSLTVFISMLYSAIFVLQVIAAFAILQQLN